VREESETLAYRESAASFTCNVYRFLLEINVMDFDSLYLGSTQSTGGAEGKDAQVPAMNEKGELMSFSVIEQVLVVFFDVAKQSHQIEG